MASIPASVLAINGGSSSIKFAVYHAGTLPKPSLSGKLDRIGRDGTTLSWRALLGREADDVRPAEAVALFCYQAKKGVCAFAAALGGLDMLVFSAGIAEQSASIRARICEGLGLLGIKPHDGRDAEHAAVSSVGRDRGPAPIRLGFKNEVHEFSGRTRAFRLE